MKRKSKIIGIVLALMLAVGAAAAGTLAWLTAESARVTNTFTVGKIIEDEKDFVLSEHEIQRQEDGTYSFKKPEEETATNCYTVVPGNNLPKDPFVKVKPAEDAYLFVEIIDSLPEALTWSMDSGHWTQLKDKSNASVLKDNNEIWYYTAAPIKAKTELTQTETNIMMQTDGQGITVPPDFDPGTMPSDATLEFQAYLCQATGFADAYDAWNKCFGMTTP